ncbi:kelch repeat-containing protein [Tundrisphaera sp. TA3]|uniref:kelch repeat-containing protein n=1 Tax=Tundrisphaera sp. TA3 TaxID=3435775 RepID=UPI003EBEE5B0
MPSLRIPPRSSRQRSSRRSRTHFLTSLDHLEERQLLAISAMSQYHSFATNVASGPVLLATFSDSEAAPSGHSAQIDWGDGTTSAGSIVADTNVPGRFNVTGQHTFAKQGMNQVSVTITNLSTTTSRTVSSVDSALIPEPIVTAIAPSGISVGATVADAEVATFLQADTSRTAADFAATVTWGDGQVTGGTITADGVTPGLFRVTASKPSAYSAAGDLTFKVDVSVLQSGGGYGWRGAAGMPEALGFVTPATTGGQIYQIGGSYGQQTRNVNAFDPTTNTWTARAPLPGQDQILATATGPDGRIYAMAYDPDTATRRMDVYNPTTDAWSTGAALAVPDGNFRMTTGPDGLIYIVGGSVSNVITAASYAYDPATDSVASIANLPTARQNVGLATGTDGRIYALGGDDVTSTVTRVDIYDPATNTWSAGVDMPDQRAAMIAGVAPDGKIYSIGGYNNQSGWVTSAFAFDATTGTWSATPSIPSFRLYVGGAVGPDGRIYSMGNAGPSNQNDAFNPINTVGTDSELFSVAKGTPTIAWAIPGPILVGTPLGAIQLNASASTSGTFAYAQAAGTVLQAGLGQTLSVTFTPDDVANYDPATATTTIDVLAPPTITVGSPTAVVSQALTGIPVAMFTAPTFPGATASDFVATITWADNTTTTGIISADPNVPGQFLVSASGPGQTTQVGTRSYRVTVDIVGQAIPATWASVHDFGDRLYYHAAATSGGKVYIIGGYDDDGRLADVLAYDPATQAIAPVASLPIELAYHAATTGLDGKIYVMGGDNSSTNYVKSAYVYDPAADAWTPIADMPTGRDYLSAATGPDGRIYAIGGYDGDNYSDAMEVFDPATGAWSTAAPLPVGVGYGAAATGPDGRIYFIGGYDDDGYSSKVYAYDPATDTWAQVASMPVPSAYLSAARGPDGRIYAIGGYNDDGYLDTVYAYDTATDTWTQVAGLAVGNYGSAATTGPDGQVYLVGGYLQSGDSTTIDVLGRPLTPSVGADGAVALVAGPATSFVVSGVTGGTVGGTGTIVVTAYDAFGNVATGYSGPVQITSTDPNAILPAEPVLVNGVGTFVIGFRTAGAQSIRVANPEAPDVAATQSFSVARAQPIAGPLTSSPEQPFFGQPLTLTASYTVPGALAGAVLGMVDFYDGEVYLGSAPLVVSEAGGTAFARFTIATLAPGNHAFRSVYSGDGNNLAADSQAPSPTSVTPATTAVALTATANGREVTLSARVFATSPGSPAVSGTVAFYDGETLLGIATIVDGVATLSVADLPLGQHSFRAVFSGDAGSSASQATVGFNLDAQSPSTPSPNPGNPTPTPPGQPTPTPPGQPVVVGPTVSVEGPKVIGLSRFGIRARRAVLELKFDGPLDVASALDRSNYRITRRNGRRIAIKRVVYDEATNTVRIVTARGLRLARAYNLTVSPRLSDRSGNRLDGRGIGQPGTAFKTKVRWTALSIPGRSPAVTFVDGQPQAYTGRFRRYVRNVLQTTIPRLRRG